jgi:glycosyltransferase involved in cell wall biosynthesis
LAQNRPVHEIIVVDDGSADKTVALVRAFAAERSLAHLQVLPADRNQGPSAARNRGWDVAASDWIAFCDADDTWLADKLESMLALLDEYPDAECLTHAFAVRGHEPPSGGGACRRASFWGVLLKNILQSSCVMVRRGLPERFDEGMRYNEDHELFARLTLQRKVIYCQRVQTLLGRPVLSRGGQSSNLWKMRLGEMRTYYKLSKRSGLVALALPGLLLFSAAKHARKLLQLRGV